MRGIARPRDPGIDTMALLLIMRIIRIWEIPPMSDPVPGYRKIPTRHGDYFVSWEPRHVEHLLHSENLSPHDLRLQDSRQAHRLIRDLFLLGVREEGLADTRGE